MEFRPIKTENDYNLSLRRIEDLCGAKKDTPQGDELDLLCTLVESWEMQHYPILLPEPVDAFLFRMEQMELPKTAMAKYLGSQGRISEILSRKRKLSLKMVKSLCKGLSRAC